SVVANPTSVLLGGSGSTVTVTLKDSTGNPLPGKTVSLAQSGSSTITPNAGGVTDSSGQATFAVNDATSEQVTYTATDVTDNDTVLAETATVTFHGPVDGSTSTITAVPYSVADNGTDTSTVTVTLVDSFGTPIPGDTVTLSQGAGHSSIQPSATAVTDINGQAVFTVSD